MLLQDDNAVATKLNSKCHSGSQLQRNREQLSSVVGGKNKRESERESVETPQLVYTHTKNDGGVFKLKTPVRIGAVHNLPVQFLQVIICPAGAEN